MMRANDDSWRLAVRRRTEEEGERYTRIKGRKMLVARAKPERKALDARSSAGCTE